MTTYNEMQTLKRRLFAMRNGALAENMRRQGAKYRIIFGVNLPQLIEIASETPKSAQLAQALWDNQTTRESMLIAPMLFPQEKFDIEVARKWISTVTTPEVCDIFCHKLLRYMNYALQIVSEIKDSENEMKRYTAIRLLFNLLPGNLDFAYEVAKKEAERKCQLTEQLSRMLIDEIEFLQD